MDDHQPEVPLVRDLGSVAANSAAELGREIRTLIEGLMKEGERAAVVVGAARLELALEHLLTRVMRAHPGGSDNLFDPDRPLGTFSSKIAMAFRLGLLSPEVESALQIVRRIRNNFAHSVGSASLSEASHSNRLRELTERCRVSSKYVAMLETLKPMTSTEKLAQFCTALVLLIVGIEFAAVKARPLDVQYRAELI